MEIAEQVSVDYVELQEPPGFFEGNESEQMQQDVASMQGAIAFADALQMEVPDEVREQVNQMAQEAQPPKEIRHFEDCGTICPVPVTECALLGLAGRSQKAADRMNAIATLGKSNPNFKLGGDNAEALIAQQVEQFQAERAAAAEQLLPAREEIENHEVKEQESAPVKEVVKADERVEEIPEPVVEVGEPEEPILVEKSSSAVSIEGISVADEIVVPDVQPAKSSEPTVVPQPEVATYEEAKPPQSLTLVESSIDSPSLQNNIAVSEDIQHSTVNAEAVAMVAADVEIYKNEDTPEESAVEHTVIASSQPDAVQTYQQSVDEPVIATQRSEKVDVPQVTYVDVVSNGTFYIHEPSLPVTTSTETIMVMSSDGPPQTFTTVETGDTTSTSVQIVENNVEDDVREGVITMQQADGGVFVPQEIIMDEDIEGSFIAAENVMTISVFNDEESSEEEAVEVNELAADSLDVSENMSESMESAVSDPSNTDNPAATEDKEVFIDVLQSVTEDTSEEIDLSGTFVDISQSEISSVAMGTLLPVESSTSIPLINQIMEFNPLFIIPSEEPAPAFDMPTQFQAFLDVLEYPLLTDEQSVPIDFQQTPSHNPFITMAWVEGLDESNTDTLPFVGIEIQIPQWEPEVWMNEEIVIEAQALEAVTASDSHRESKTQASSDELKQVFEQIQQELNYPVSTDQQEGDRVRLEALEQLDPRILEALTELLQIIELLNAATSEVNEETDHFKAKLDDEESLLLVAEEEVRKQQYNKATYIPSEFTYEQFLLLLWSAYSMIVSFARLDAQEVKNRKLSYQKPYHYNVYNYAVIPAL